MDDILPSQFGYKSIRPRTRTERLRTIDKESLERSRIEKRVGLNARYDRRYAPGSSSALTTCTADAAGYMSDADRFHTDTAGEEYRERQQAIERRKQIDEFRRNQNFQREEQRWKTVLEYKSKDEEHWQKLRDSGLKAKKNQSNAAYDVITLDYHKDTHGEQQKYHDDMIKYRAKLRAKALIEKGDTRVNYDIISGDARPPLPQPSPVSVPMSLITGPKSDRVDYRRL